MGSKMRTASEGWRTPDLGVDRRLSRFASVSLGLPPATFKYWGGKEVIDMAKNIRQTGKNAASAAGKVLANPKSTKAEKAAAASALAQTPTSRRGR